MTTIRPYVYRDYRACFLPREVLDVLGEPSHVRQGRVVVFAATAEAAWRRLSTLDMEPTSARHLQRADLRAGHIKPLIDASLDRDGAVYAMPLNGWTVVSITQDQSDRIIEKIGEIRTGRFLPSADVSELRDRLTDYCARLEVPSVRPINGVVTIMAESLADALLPFVHGEIARELRHYAEVEDIRAESADGRRGGGDSLSPSGWAGKAVAHEQVARDLRTRADDLDPKGANPR